MTVTEGDETLVTSKVNLPLGSISEIVVHMPASPTGDPMITRFDNNLEAVQSGRAAHSVAHVASAGPIDIRINENVVSANVANGSTPIRSSPPVPAAWTSSRPGCRSRCSARSTTRWKRA